MLQVVIYHATNPDTPFVVTETSFSDLIDKTEDELEAMLEVLKKRFIKVFPDGKGITCFYSGLEVVPLTHAGFTQCFLSTKGIRPSNRMTQDRPD